MRIPDWFVYIVILIAIVYALFSESDSHNAPPTLPQPNEEAGPLLPGPSVFDEDVLVQVDGVSDGLGTAFAVGSDGVWMTARHVVDGCEVVGLQISRRQVARVQSVEVSDRGDLALLFTNRAPRPTAVDFSQDLRIGQRAFHFGYPQGQPGEVASRLLSRSRLTTRGRFNTVSPVLAWAEIGRTRGLTGTLGGMSGGPVFDSDGEVIGVTIAESPRRGRIYTTTPAFTKAFVDDRQVELDGRADPDFDPLNYGAEADKFRRELSVVKVVCQSGSGL